MAIARLNKIKVITHQSQKDGLLSFLQEKGNTEIIDAKSSKEESAYSIFLSPENESQQVRLLEKSQQELLWFIDFISSVNKTKRCTVKKSEFTQTLQNFQYQPILKQAKAIESSLKELQLCRNNLFDKMEKLLPWQGLNADLADISRTAYTVMGIGAIKEQAFEKIKAELKKNELDIYFEAVNKSGGNVFVLFIYIKHDETVVESLFKKYSLEHAYFPQAKGSPAEILDSIRVELKTIGAKEKALAQELSGLASRKKEIMILFDDVSNQNRKEGAKAKLLRTEEVYVIEAWAKKSQISIFKKQIEEKFPESELFIEEPGSKDEVPVILENKKFLEPFELITKIYGMPAYNELDPTPFLAPFFFVFFGFCITDAAYGIILALFSLFVLKKFKMGWMGNRFFRLLLYGGISTIILGALSGGWFGNLIDILAENNNIVAPIKKIKDSITLLDPIKEPMKLLVIALSLGFVQIWSAHLIAIYGNLKNRRYLDALFDQVSTLIFLFGFTGLILNMLGVVPKHYSNIFTVSMVIGGAAILFTAGRQSHSFGEKLFNGAFILYSTCSGYISDILSYSRLWALGLVTGVMATTCNMMASIIAGMVPLVGFLIGILILVAGHTFSLAMNLLGAFIHPIRLQFVEFFSKFFKGGGREFNPLRLENKYTVVE